MAGIPSVNTSTWRLPQKAHAVPEASYTDDMYRAKGLPTAPSAPTTGGSGLPVVNTSEWRLPPKGEQLTESTEPTELAEPEEASTGLPYSEEDVVEYLRSRRSKGRVTVSELAQTFGGNQQAHTKFLQRLAEQGKLSYHRHSAGGFYTLAMGLVEPQAEAKACKRSYLKKRRPKVEAMKKCKKKGSKAQMAEDRQEQRRLAGLELSEHLPFATGTPYRQLPEETELPEAAELLSESTYYRQRFSNGDEIYFLQTGTLKNGNPKGFQVDFYGGRSKKAKKGRLLKMDVGSKWKLVPEKDVPKSVMKKFAAVEEGLEDVPVAGIPADQRVLAGMTESRGLPYCVTDAAPRASVRAHGILDDGQDGGDGYIGQVLSESRWFFRDFGDLGLGVVRPFEETPGGRSGPWRGSDDEPAPTPIVRKGKIHGVVGKQKSPEEKGEVDVGRSEIDYDHEPDEPEEEPEKKQKKAILKKKKGKKAPPEEPEEHGAEDEEDDEAQTEGKLMKALASRLKGAGRRVSGGKHAQRVKTKARERLHTHIKKFKAHHGIKDRD